MMFNSIAFHSNCSIGKVKSFGKSVVALLCKLLWAVFASLEPIWSSLLIFLSSCGLKLTALFFT